MPKTRHSSIPLKRTATGQGFAVQSNVKGLRAEFETYKKQANSTLDQHVRVIDGLIGLLVRIRPYAVHTGARCRIGVECHCGLSDLEAEITKLVNIQKGA